jgi:uncharacterized protein YjbI with pentapeptide repeats
MTLGVREISSLRSNLRKSRRAEAYISRHVVAYLSGVFPARAADREADLQRAHLSRWNLSAANLGGSNLRGAKLQGANLGRATRDPLLPFRKCINTRR